MALKDKINKYSQNIYKLISYTYILFIIYILTINILSFKINYSRNKTIDKYNIILILLGILFTFIIYYIIKKINTYIKRPNLIINIVILIIFIYMILTFNYYYFNNNYDAGMIMKEAINIVNGTELYEKIYFEKYPNNLFILFLEVYIYKILLFFKIQLYFPYILIFLNCLIVAISLKLITKILYLLKFRQEIILLSLTLSILLLALSPWIIVFYTDILGMFFIIILYYLFIKIKNNYLNIFLVMLIFYIGYSIKPHLFFVLISIIVYSIFKFKEKINLKSIFSAIIGLLISIILVKSFINSYNIDLDKNKRMTYAHFIMMGHNRDSLGIYNNDDVKISLSYDTVENRQKANISILKDRLQEYGIINTLKLYTKKNLINYNDGTFAFYQDSSISTIENTEKGVVYDNIFKNYYYNKGKYNIVFRIIMQSLWLGVLFLSLFSKNNFYSLMFKLSLMGISLFLTLFEDSARYIFQFVPIFIICAMYGVQNIIEIKNKILKKEN